MSAPRNHTANRAPRPGRGGASDHFDGARFFNPPPEGVEKTFFDFLRWRMRRNDPEWRKVPVVPSMPDERVAGGEMRATWVGHATLLVQFDGMNLLTDPIWSARAFPLPFLGPRRLAEPGVRFGDLPPIDLVLVSHDHYDHLDRRTVRRLAEAHDPHFFVPLGLARWFERRGIFRVTELDWWEGRSVGPLHVHAVPARHWSRRGLFDERRRLWCGWVVEGEAGRFFFSGDTGYSRCFSRIGGRFAPIRLAAIPIGAYEPRWFMAPQHVNPEEAVAIHRDLGAETSVAIHHATFKLADDPQDAPPRLLREALARAGLPSSSFQVLRHGEALILARRGEEAPLETSSPSRFPHSDIARKTPSECG